MGGLYSFDNITGCLQLPFCLNVLELSSVSSLTSSPFNWAIMVSCVYKLKWSPLITLCWLIGLYTHTHSNGVYTCVM